jgi:hypothetical protein
MGGSVGPELGIEILLLVALAQVLAVCKPLRLLYKRQAQVELAAHLGHAAPVAACGYEEESHPGEGTAAAPPLDRSAC